MSAPPVMDNGLIWCATGTASAELGVTDSIVVSCSSAMRAWALHRPADEVWRRVARHDGDLVWIPDA